MSQEDIDECEKCGKEFDQSEMEPQDMRFFMCEQCQKEEDDKALAESLADMDDIVPGSDADRI